MVIDMNLEEVLKKYYGYEEFRGPQKEVIEAILAKRDTLTILPTGMGKSLIYQIPGILLPGLVVVVSPLISLMKDQVLNLNKLGLKAKYITSELSFTEINDIYRHQERYKFLYVSAERLENLLFLEHIKEVSLLVVDEAHTIKWGADFRKSLYHIKAYIAKLKQRPVVACFTATLNKRDINLVIDKAGLINPLVTNYLPLKDNINFVVYKNYKKYHLNKLLNKHLKTIVYSLTRYKTERLYEEYSNRDDVYIYHGGLDPKTKNSNYLGFKNSKSGVIFATNAFGMGIDIPDIRQVVLYDLPQNMSDLIQQAGRAGRDLLPCCCYILFSNDSLDVSLKFIYNSSLIKQGKKDLDEVVKFCFVKDKKEYIRSYFNK